jgi:hypothetical protein
MNSLFHVAAAYPKPRLEKTLKRFGLSPFDIGSGAADGVDPDDETFFSASDDDSPTAAKSSVVKAPSAVKARGSHSHEKQRARQPVSQLYAAPVREAEPSQSKMKVDDDVELEQLETGYFRLDKEERDLLREVLAEKKSRQGPQSSSWCCPCRRRCLPRSHKS